MEHKCLPEVYCITPVQWGFPTTEAVSWIHSNTSREKPALVPADVLQNLLIKPEFRTATYPACCISDDGAGNASHNFYGFSSS